LRDVIEVSFWAGFVLSACIGGLLGWVVYAFALGTFPAWPGRFLRFSASGRAYTVTALVTTPVLAFAWSQ